MAFRIRRSRPLPKEVAKAARGELKRVGRQLAKPLDDGDESIHQLRVGMKRIRALLLLIREPMGEPAYRAGQARCKALADSYAGSRDASVGLTLLSGLLLSDPDPEQRLRISTGFERALPAGVSKHPPLDAAVEELRLMRHQVRSWPIGSLRLRHLSGRLKRQYGRARRLNRQVRADDAMILMHEWRKVVKQLLYQLDLLAGSGDEKLRKHLRQLGARLGELHDLDMLELQIESRAELFWLDDRLLLRRLMQQRRRSLRTRALHHGDKVFASKPKRFVRARFEHWQRSR
ncbi:CHAD domain-containing protein [Marinobacterium sedimentorum]|uniref:CHAD domain-containing protein n=1 Tax=Marinobacterium sedimentorum TaxID=2927804 RepID=UPI0020C716D0|nr:CHAD domain-containing protein [Marinobacterium sedimentorum]MCP8689079.1 CHAD domain-containing protein [Marinobacterium sedimentorum]